MEGKEPIGFIIFITILAISRSGGSGDSVGRSAVASVPQASTALLAPAGCPWVVFSLGGLNYTITNWQTQL